MDTIALNPERQAELEKFASEHGQTIGEALDEAVAAFLEWQRQDFLEAVAGIRRGYEDVKAGRTRPAQEFFDEMRQKHGIPR